MKDVESMPWTDKAAIAGAWSRSMSRREGDPMIAAARAVAVQLGYPALTRQEILAIVDEVCGGAWWRGREIA